MFKSEAKVNHLIHVQANMLQLVLVIRMRYSEWSTSKYVAFKLRCVYSAGTGTAI